MHPKCPFRTFVKDENRRWFTHKETKDRKTYCEECYFDLILDKDNFIEITNKNNWINCDYPHDYSRKSVTIGKIRIFIINEGSNVYFPKIGETEENENAATAEFDVPTCSTYKILVENFGEHGTNLTSKSFFLKGKKLKSLGTIETIGEWTDPGFMFICPTNKTGNHHVMNFEITRYKTTSPVISFFSSAVTMKVINKPIGPICKFTIQLKSMQDELEIKTTNEEYLDKLKKMKTKLGKSMERINKEKTEVEDETKKLNTHYQHKKWELEKLESKLEKKQTYNELLVEQINLLT